MKGKTMTTNGRSVADSAAEAHAARIRAGEEERAAVQSTRPAGQSTAEHYAARILPGYKADEAARERARASELRSRGLWVPSDDEPAEDVEEEYEEPEGEVEDTEDAEEVDDASLPTWERYAARERKRIAAEREANIAAWRGSSEVAWRNSVRPI